MKKVIPLKKKSKKAQNHSVRNSVDLVTGFSGYAGGSQKKVYDRKKIKLTKIEED